MSVEYKHRVLASTVGSWNSATGSNTMSELFCDYDKDKLACIYIRADYSDSPSCHNYFHIYEGRVMKSIINRGIETGEFYVLGDRKKNCDEISGEKARYNFFRRKSNWFFLFIREFVWVFGKWKSKKLNSFLDGFHPETVVFPIESYIHFNRINEYIIKRCKPQNVIGYLWDDNFTYKQHPNNIGYIIHRWWLRHGVKRLVGKCTTVLAICPKMKREVDAEYGIDSIVLTKPINQYNDLRLYAPHYPIRILYTGKLIYGRDQTIAEIVDAIKEINNDGQKVLLQLYTNTELSPSLRDRICVEGSCEMKGFVPQNEVLRIQKGADVLLYAESLADDDLTARLSFSTKMTDYLSSGVCIWAVGNKDLAPIEYLQEQSAGIVSTDRDSIISALNKMIQDSTILANYAANAQACGKRNHNKDEISKAFVSALCRY